jgi:hypothetical protein
MRAAMIGGLGYASYQAGKRGAEQREHEYDQDAELAALRQQAARVPPPATPQPQPGTANIETLAVLKGLLDSGALTQEEFDAQKRRILMDY